MRPLVLQNSRMLLRTSWSEPPRYEYSRSVSVCSCSGRPPAKLVSRHGGEEKRRPNAASRPLHCPQCLGGGGFQVADRLSAPASPTGRRGAGIQRRAGPGSDPTSCRAHSVARGDETAQEVAGQRHGQSPSPPAGSQSPRTQFTGCAPPPRLRARSQRATRKKRDRAASVDPYVRRRSRACGRGFGLTAVLLRKEHSLPLLGPQQVEK